MKYEFFEESGDIPEEVWKKWTLKKAYRLSHPNYIEHYQTDVHYDDFWTKFLKKTDWDKEFKQLLEDSS